MLIKAALAVSFLANAVLAYFLIDAAISLDHCRSQQRATKEQLSADLFLLEKGLVGRSVSSLLRGMSNEERERYLVRAGIGEVSVGEVVLVVDRDLITGVKSIDD